MEVPFDLILVVLVIAALLSGIPVAVVLIGVPVLVSAFAILFGAFDASLYLALPPRLFGTVTNSVLIAIPAFVFMGLMLKEARIVENALAAMRSIMGNSQAGLLISMTAVGVMLAASTGIVGASVVGLGVLALPVLLRAGVPPSLASGSVVAVGTLGQIIPPSIVLIVLGDQMSNAWQVMQVNAGEFAPETVSVSDLFAGALFPGLLLAALFVCFQYWQTRDMQTEPDIQTEQDQNTHLSAWVSLGGALFLIPAVLGAILLGVATPSEGASVGAVVAVLLASMQVDAGGKRPVAIVALLGLAALVVTLICASLVDLNIAIDDMASASFVFLVVAILAVCVLAFSLLASVISLIRSGMLRRVLTESVHLSSAIFFIVWGAVVFSLVFRGLGGDERITDLLTDLPGGTYGALITVLLVMFLLGFFLEFLEICLVVVPLVAPVLLSMPVAGGGSMNPIWLGVLIALVLQTSFLTPPFGVALFYLKSVVPAGISAGILFRGVIPFVLLQLLAVVIVMFFPQLATFLPDVMFGL